MALISREQLQLGHEAVSAHSDFDHEWIRTLLAHPGIHWMVNAAQRKITPDHVSNSMFEETLYGQRGIRAHLSFRRPCREPDAIRTYEHCFLISIGDALDGKTGRAHGGLSSLLLDHISGHVAHASDDGLVSPATATLTINYRRPLDTPSVVLVRAWAIVVEGRKVWVKGAIENADANLIADSKTLFILARKGPQL